MPKITLEIPKWAFGRHIYILAGTELLGKMEFRREKIREDRLLIKEYYLPLKVKPNDGRCNGCGDCCGQGGSFVGKQKLDEIRDRLNNYTYSKTGKCPMLSVDGCTLNSAIPFSCIKSNCEGWSENCTEKLIDLMVR